MQSLTIRVKNLCVILEERLLLKLVAFFGYSNNGQELENLEENDFETQQILADVTSVHSKRYYFEILEIVLGQVKYLHIFKFYDNCFDYLLLCIWTDP